MDCVHKVKFVEVSKIIVDRHTPGQSVLKGGIDMEINMLSTDWGDPALPESPPAPTE